MTPVLTILKLIRLESWLLICEFLYWWVVFGEVVSTLEAELGAMRDSSESGPQEMSLFAWERWTSINSGI